MGLFTDKMIAEAVKEAAAKLVMPEGGLATPEGSAIPKALIQNEGFIRSNRLQETASNLSGSFDPAAPTPPVQKGR